MKKHITLLLLLFFYWCPGHGQIIKESTNKFRPGDIIIKQQVEYKEPGISGENLRWDFSHTNILNEKYQLVYYYPQENDTTLIAGYEHNTQYNYQIKRDTLFLKGFQNSTSEIKYSKPEIVIKFPFQYGDSLTSDFISEGLYSQKINVSSSGRYSLIADGRGELITPENDTLQVIRVCKQKTIKTNTSSNQWLKQNTYQWYVTGCRYPVFETIESYTISTDSTYKNFGTSFYYTTIEREQLPTDLANANELINNNQSDNIIINCQLYPNPVKSDLLVKYELTTDANVSFLLCDMRGFPWKSVKTMSLGKGAQQQKINMYGLPTGNYGLFISVNSKIYKMTVIKI